MKTATSIEGVRTTVNEWKKQGRSIGLVPTMGFLHEGHASLMREARRRTHEVVVSIFVNPAQFGPNEDLERYPRDPEHDLSICRAEGVGLVFMPDAATVYPPGFQTFVEVEGLSRGLCGASRPGHFRGVCTVVCKLFNIIGPDKAFFGQKDAQQLAVIRRMVQDLNLPLEIVGCPIVRDEDGLAKSSRNAYLDFEERKAALSLNRALALAATIVMNGERNAAALKATIQRELEAHPLIRIDYVDVVDADSLEPLNALAGDVLIALAAFAGKTRLIDNRVLHLGQDLAT